MTRSEENFAVSCREKWLKAFNFCRSQLIFVQYTQTLVFILSQNEMLLWFWKLQSIFLTIMPSCWLLERFIHLEAKGEKKFQKLINAPESSFYLNSPLIFCRVISLPEAVGSCQPSKWDCSCRVIYSMVRNGTRRDLGDLKPPCTSLIVLMNYRQHNYVKLTKLFN